VIGLANKEVRFEQDEKKLLTKDTRRNLAEKVNERLDSEAAFEGKRYPLRNVMQMQARHLATYLRAERLSYEAYQMSW
jgi:CRISPR-associated protein Cas1